ncbi:MAG TPA: hypothetical protein VK622_12555 [Puia sp.]|nr:hypothetical protein [Puia sp.]
MKIMKISGHKGSLMSGKDADIVLFDEHINVHTTVVKGKIVFPAPDK